jgi:hypothetical protein
MSMECQHGQLWLARDGYWRCERCDPPFEGEVLERREQDEILRLFDDEETSELARRAA